MHIYGLARGKHTKLEERKYQLGSVYYPYKTGRQLGMPESLGNIIDADIQMSVRHIQLWEIVVPESAKNDALAKLCAQHGTPAGWFGTLKNKLVSLLGLTTIEASDLPAPDWLMFRDPTLSFDLLGFKEDKWRYVCDTEKCPGQTGFTSDKKGKEKICPHCKKPTKKCFEVL